MTKKIAMIRFARFKPSEAAVLTGMSVASQRDYRRRGHLSANTGAQASFDPLDISVALIIRTCSERGIGPSLGARIAKHIGPRLLLKMLGYRLSVKDDTGVMREWMDENSKSQIEYFLEKTRLKPIGQPQRFAIVWSTDLVGEQAKAKSDDGDLPLFFCDDIEDAFDKAIKSKSAFGPAIVFDLKNLALYLMNQKVVALGSTPDLARIEWEEIAEKSDKDRPAPKKKRARA